MNLDTIQLPVRRASLEGMVDLIGQQDAQGVLVQVQNTSYAALTDPSGAYQLSNVPEGQYTVVASHPNYQSASASDQTVKAGSTTQVPQLKLQPLFGSISGQVNLEKQKNHIGVIVSVVGTGCLDVTDINGSFVINNVPIGTRTLVALMQGWTQQTVNVSVSPGQTTKIRSITLKSISSR
jgi:hypothetical protein